MKTFGQVLRSHREKLGLNLDELMGKTTIPTSIIEALENHTIAALPTATLVRGYVQLLARVLRIPEETALALYRRDLEPHLRAANTTNTTTATTPVAATTPNSATPNTKTNTTTNTNVSSASLHKPHRSPYTWLSPRTLSLTVFSTIVIIGTAFAIWQWNAISHPPALDVTQPQPWTVVSSPVTITGRTQPDSTLTINTQVVSLSPEGDFRFDLSLPSGERAIVIQAADSRGRRQEKIIFVTVE